MKQTFLVLTVLLSLLFIHCPLPPNPDTNPDNASASIITINGTEPSTVEKVTAQTEVTVEYSVTLPKFIDSLVIEILSSQKSVEARYVIEGPWEKNGFETIMFLSAGTKSCVLTTYRTNDSQSETTQVFEVTYPEGNQRPVWSSDTVELRSTKKRETTRNLGIYVTDPENNLLTYAILSNDEDAFSLTDSLLTASSEVPSGKHLLTIAVTDGSLTDTGVVVWTIIDQSEEHAEVTNDNAVTLVDSTVAIDVLANDRISSGSLILTRVGQPANGQTTIKGTHAVYTPDSGFSGRDTFNYIVNERDSGKVYVTVTDTIENTPPFWNPDTVEFSSEKDRNDTLNISEFGTDDDADSLFFYVKLSGEDAFSFDESTASMSTDGSSDSGYYLFTVTVGDGIAYDTGYIKWHVYIVPEEEAQLHDDTAVGLTGNSLTIRVLENDSIVSGSMVLTGAVDGDHGTAVVRGSAIIYTPEEDFTGTDEALYIVNGRDTARIFLTITASEITLIPDSLTLSEGQSRTVNVLGNDITASDTLTLDKVIDGTKGTAVISGDSSITYTATGSSTGIDSVHYVVSSGDTGLVIITIEPAELLINDDSLTVIQGGTRTLHVLENDSISAGTLIVNRATDGKQGTVSITDSTIIYTANDDADGNDSILYFVNNDRDSAMVRITLLPIEITTGPDSATVSEDGGPIAIAVLENDNATEGSSLTLEVTDVLSADLGSAVVRNDSVIFTPSPDANGIDTLVYIVNEAAEETLVITITPVNDLPVFTYRDTTVDLDENTRDTLVLRATDPDGTPVEFTVSGSPSWATVSGGTDSIRFILAPGFDAVDASDAPALTFTVQAKSGSDSILQKVTITVHNVNTAPAFTDPETALTVPEGATDSVTFTATDAEGDVLTYDVETETIPSWISVSKAGGLTFTATPGHSVAPYSSALVVSVTDGALSTTHTVTVTVNQAFILETTSTPAAGGNVTIVPEAESYSEGTVVTLTATESSGFRFTGWSGDTTATNNPLTITMQKDREIEANFIPQYTLTMEATEGGTVIPSVATTVDMNTATTITATPETGYVFKQWNVTDSATVADPTDSTTTVQLTGNATVEAEFVCITFEKSITEEIFGHLNVVQWDDGSYFISGSYDNEGVTNTKILKLDVNGTVERTWTYGNDENNTSPYSMRKITTGLLLAGSSSGGIQLRTVAANGNELMEKTFISSGPYLTSGRFAFENSADEGFIVGGIGMYQGIIRKADRYGNLMSSKSFTLFSGLFDGLQSTPSEFIFTGGNNSTGYLHILKTDTGCTVTSLDSFPCPTSTTSRIAKTDDGGIIIGISGEGIPPCRLWRFSSEGDMLWQKNYPDLNSLCMVKEASDGGFTFAGSTTILGEGENDFYLRHTDADGATNWTRTFGTDSGDEKATRMELTSDGGYTIVGTNSSSNDSFYIVKTDATGIVNP